MNSSLNDRDLEIVLGFDVRADPDATWTDRGARPAQFLLRNVAQPLAADSSVWPYRPSDTLRGAKSFSVRGWRFFSEDDARTEFGKDQVMIAVTVRLAGMDDALREEWRRYAWIKTPPAMSWVLLGYDVGDRYCLSGLSNCGYGAERGRWAAEWGESLNDQHLFSDPHRADAFARASDARISEHAPFTVFGLYRLPR